MNMIGSYPSDFRDYAADYETYREKARNNYIDSKISWEQYLKEVSDVPLTFDSYQDSIEWTTARNPSHIDRLTYMSLGIAGEAGEIVDEIKKLHRNDKGVLTEDRKAKIVEESGDLLYYIAGLLASIDVSLEETARKAQTKAVRRFREYLDANKI